MNEAFAPLKPEQSPPETSSAGDGWQRVTPVPPGAPPLTVGLVKRCAPVGFTPSRRWDYCNSVGELLGHIVRYDRPANGVAAAKAFKPFTVWEGPDGEVEWQCKGFAEPRPLYHLDEVVKRHQAPVLVVEGEKAVDAAQTVFPDHVVITSPNGSKSASKADWSPLAGRNVMIWPDNDQPGATYAQEVAELVAQAGAAAINIVKLPVGLTNGWDLADGIPDGIALEDIRAALEEPGRKANPDLGPDLSILKPHRTPPPPFPGEVVFGVSWAEWIATAAEAKGAPPDYVAVGLLSVAGSLIGNSRWSAPWEGWAEPPVLWTLLIGTPSANKSPGLKALTIPLDEVSARVRLSAECEVAAWEEEAACAAVRQQEWETGRDNAIKAGQPIPERPADSHAGERPITPLLSVNDVTTERLTVVLSRQHRGTLLVRDELSGWLANMSRYANGGSDKPFWLEAYGGGSYAQERQSRQTYVRRLTVGVTGCIVPDNLRNLLLKVEDDGLLARLIPVWPDRAPVARPTRQPDDHFAESAFEKLYRLDMVPDTEGNPRPYFVSFTDAARDLLLEFKKMTRDLEDAEEGLLVSFIGKMPGFAVRLALILAHLDWAGDGAGEPPREVDDKHFARAAHFVEEYALPMARRAYADASQSNEDRAGRRLAQLIVDEGLETFTVREITQRGRSGLKQAAEVKSAIAMLAEAGWLNETKVAPSSTGGRPQTVWTVHQAVRGAS